MLISTLAVRLVLTSWAVWDRAERRPAPPALTSSFDSRATSSATTSPARRYTSAVPCDISASTLFNILPNHTRNTVTPHSAPGPVLRAPHTPHKAPHTPYPSSPKYGTKSIFAFGEIYYFLPQPDIFTAIYLEHFKSR